jgi:hypothetical protein
VELEATTAVESTEYRVSALKPKAEQLVASSFQMANQLTWANDYVKYPACRREDSSLNLLPYI